MGHLISLVGHPTPDLMIQFPGGIYRLIYEGTGKIDKYSKNAQSSVTLSFKNRARLYHGKWKGQKQCKGGHGGDTLSWKRWQVEGGGDGKLPQVG